MRNSPRKFTGPNGGGGQCRETKHTHTHTPIMTTTTTVDLNVGLARPDGGENTIANTLAAIRQYVGTIQRHRVATSHTEPTVCARAVLAVEDHHLAVAALAEHLGQDCVAAVPDTGTPYLAGPNAAAWGDFDARFWLSVD